MRNACVALAGLVAALAASPAALGGDDALDRARAAAAAGKPEEAAALFGKAIADAQKRGDLLAEQDAADALCDLRLPEDPRGIMAAAMGQLDPARRGAFVSAPLLAGEILLAAALVGDAGHVDAAASTLKAAVADRKCGDGITALARLGEGMVHARAGEAARAVGPLGVAQTAGIQHGWTEVAILAGAELAAAHLAAGEPGRATEALEASVKALRPVPESRHLNVLSTLSHGRFGEAPEAVRRPLLAALERATGGGGIPGEPGGVSGAGAEGGGPPLSPVGQALRSAPRSKALVALLRGEKSFEMRVLWDAKYRGLSDGPVAPRGVAALDRGGVTVHVTEGGAAIRMVDPEGRDGQPGCDAAPHRLRAFYRLARGETWNLFRDGTVTITAK